MEGLSRPKVRVGLVGIGNNASAIVQGVRYYGAADGAAAAAEHREGIRFPTLCGYAVGDVEFTCAFDVDARKVGRDLGKAIYSEPNRYPRLYRSAASTGVMVEAAPVLDGVPSFLSDLVDVAPQCANGDLPRWQERAAEIVHETNTDVLVNFLPSGSDKATEFFADIAIRGGAAYINCTPTPAVHSATIRSAFEDADLPLLGDDLESQFGSSLLHRTVLNALRARGLDVFHSYQVNLGGNTDFKNLSHRSEAKHRSKMKAVSSGDLSDRVDIVPSGGFVAGLNDNKVGYISIEGRGWLDMPVTIDIKLRVQDSSNAAGVAIDLVRLARGALDRGLGGYIPLSYYFKNPLGEKLSTEEALRKVEQFERGEAL